MSEILLNYVNRRIKNPLALSRLRDDADFMLEVFRLRKLAADFDNVSDRLKEDADFIERTKEIFSDNSLEFFNLCISLRKYRKEKEKREAEQDSYRQKEIERLAGQQKAKKKDSDIVEKTFTVNVQVANPLKGAIPTVINFDTKVPLRVEASRKASNVDKNSSNDGSETFISLVNQLPVSKDERDLLVLMYRDASEEKKLMALLMVYDFVNYNGKKHPIKLLKSPSNNVYRFTEGF